VAPRRLRQAQAALAGRVVSGDALYGQQALCRHLREADADYVFAVKGNQPTLLEDVTLLFTDPPPGERFLTARTVDKHGGRLEQRWLRASTALSTSLQVDGGVDAGLEVAATGCWPGQPDTPVRHEVRSFLSSLPATTSPARVLQAVRRHWPIENRLPWPREVTLGEDACQVRAAHAPQALAAVRNAVVGLLHQHRMPNLAAALRTFAWSPASAVLGLLGLSPP
jgi:predicted transposase YbfD/YdcC